MKINEWRNVDDIDILFLKDNSLVKHKKYRQYKNGSILHPIYNKLTPDEADSRINKIVYLSNGHSMKIKEYHSSDNVDVLFDDGSIVYNKRYHSFINGKIAHPVEGKSNKNIVDRIVEYTFDCYKRGAKNRNINFNITKEQVKHIIFQPCIYCGFEGNDTYKTAKNLSIKYNGIDRINSKKGYEDYNIVPCCSICNIAKRDKTFEEWIEYLDRLVPFYIDNKDIIDNIKGE